MSELRTTELDGIVYIVEAIQIISTKRIIYSAWVPYNDHGTMSYAQDGRCYGRVGTEPLTVALEAMPGPTIERYDAVMAYKQAHYDIAYRAILAAYPEAAYGRVRMGEVEIEGE